jgi:hypothetical protein
VRLATSAGIPSLVLANVVSATPSGP